MPDLHGPQLMCVVIVGNGVCIALVEMAPVSKLSQMPGYLVSVLGAQKGIPQSTSISSCAKRKKVYEADAGW